MPTAFEIYRHMDLLVLPSHGMVFSQDQLQWKGTELGANFTFSRALLGIEGTHPFRVIPSYQLTFEGLIIMGREKVYTDFIDALGPHIPAHLNLADPARAVLYWPEINAKTRRVERGNR